MFIEQYRCNACGTITYPYNSDMGDNAIDGLLNWDGCCHKCHSGDLTLMGETENEE